MSVNGSTSSLERSNASLTRMASHHLEGGVLLREDAMNTAETRSPHFPYAIHYGKNFIQYIACGIVNCESCLRQAEQTYLSFFH